MADSARRLRRHPSHTTDQDDASISSSRRRFLASAAIASAALSLGCRDSAERIVAPMLRRDLAIRPADSELEHVIVVMMENRSFDHFFGWRVEADGRQHHVYVDREGRPQRTHALAPDFQGCGFADPDHSFAGGRVEYNEGRCDGWLRAGHNDQYTIGYYERQDLTFSGRAAVDWMTFSRYFCSILGPTFPNRIYQHAAQTDRLSNTHTLATMPTIWDRLAAKGLTGRYYFSDSPFLSLWGNRYVSISRPVSEFFSDCAAGTLPQVAFVDPKFAGEGAGTSVDDHPHADIRAGQKFMNDIYNAVTKSSAWPNTVLLFTYDEWGGFFDHVPPPAGPIPDADRVAGNVDGLLGFRIPVTLVSPFAPRGLVAHDVYDHTSVLKLIEWRWGLDPLTVRDANANNLADVLRFDQPDLHVPRYLVPPIDVGDACPSEVTAARQQKWLPLGDLARRHGWEV